MGEGDVTEGGTIEGDTGEETRGQQMSSAAATPRAPAPHKNTRYPELQDKESLEVLTRQFGTPSRIARHPGCSKSTASYAMRKCGVKPRNFVADERVLRMLGVE